MGHQVAQGDRLGKCRRNLKVEVGVNADIQVQVALLDLLHHRRPGKELADRTDAEEGPFRIDGDALLDIGVAVALGEKELAILDHRNHSAGQVILLHLRGQVTVQEDFQFSGIIESQCSEHSAGRCQLRLAQGRRSRSQEQEDDDHPLGHFVQK
jgi:hypothetical protein